VKTDNGELLDFEPFIYITGRAFVDFTTAGKFDMNAITIDRSVPVFISLKEAELYLTGCASGYKYSVIYQLPVVRVKSEKGV
jgi:hypothetical protein